MNIFKKIVYKLIIHFPVHIRKNRILFSSIPTMSDNCLALFEYLEKTNSSYDIWWQINGADENKLSYKKTVVKGGNIFQKIKYYHVLKTSKLVIITHHPLPVSKKQNVITLWHGEPFKKWDNLGKNLVTDEKNNYFVTANKNTELLRKNVYHITNVNYYHSAQCRLSLFFDDKRIEKVRVLLSEMGIKKFIIFMPTFGGSKKNDDFLSFDYKKINDELKKKDLFLFIKLHPHYRLEDFPTINCFSNIKVVDKTFFEDNSLELYSFLSQSSGLITDLSSVFIDYLFLDKPIAFNLSKENFDNNLNAIKCTFEDLPGEIISSTEELISFCVEFCASLTSFSQNVKRNRDKFLDFYSSDNGSILDGTSNVALLIEKIINKEIA